MRLPRTAFALLAALAMVVSYDATVEARQHRSHHGNYGHVYRPSTYYRPHYRPYYYRPRIGFYGSFGYPYYYPYYWPSFGFYYGSGYYPGYYTYPYYGRYSDSQWGSFRIEVKPKQARVYVDGYYAGIVDDFDGTFQRLKVPPGNHEIVVYLEGYRTLSQTMYVSPGNSYKMKQEMVPLAPGEVQEAPPQAPQEPQGMEPPEGLSMPEPPEATPPASEPTPPAPLPVPPMSRTEAATVNADFGVLELRVQPADIGLLLDGEAWPSTDASGPISIHLPQGRHRVDIHKNGYLPFSGNVLVNAGRTTTLNVKLERSPDEN